MKNILNGILAFFKYILLMVAFSFTLIIMLRMNARLEKNLADSVFIFVPYGLLLLLFILNMILNRESVTKNIFYNLTCDFVFITNIIVGLRAIMDKNMLYNGIQKMGINFNYFNDYLAFNRIMLYGLIIANIFFMFIPNKNKPETLGSSEVPKIKKEKVRK